MITFCGWHKKERRDHMAKKSKVAKERQRQEIVEKYAELKKELKAKGVYEVAERFIPYPFA